MDSGVIVYVCQYKVLGLGYVVWCVCCLLQDEFVVVVLIDDVIMGELFCFQQMIEVYQEIGGIMVVIMEVLMEKMKFYGVLDVVEDMGVIVCVCGMVEKFKENLFLNFVVIGCYILVLMVMENLNKFKQGVGGEIQLIDVIVDEIEVGCDVFGLCFCGQCFDCGFKVGFLQVIVVFGLVCDELKDEFGDYLVDVMLMCKVVE